MLHTLWLAAHRTLKLVRADLESLGVPESACGGVNMPRTPEIGAAVEFLGCDGPIAPSARWSCENPILFADRMGVDANLEIVKSEAVDPKNRSYPGAARAGGGVGRANWPTILRQM